MIYDSPEQKQFILECVKKFPCNYEQALQLAHTFGPAIQEGQVADPKAQAKAFPNKARDVQPVKPPAEPATPANRKQRRTAQKKEVKVG
jgi:hypothetical protein